MCFKYSWTFFKSSVNPMLVLCHCYWWKMCSAVLSSYILQLLSTEDSKTGDVTCTFATLITTEGGRCSPIFCSCYLQKTAKQVTCAFATLITIEDGRCIPPIFCSCYLLKTATKHFSGQNFNCLIVASFDKYQSPCNAINLVNYQ